MHSILHMTNSSHSPSIRERLFALLLSFFEYKEMSHKAATNSGESDK